MTADKIQLVSSLASGMAEANSFQLRLLDLAGVERLVSWAKDEGWNPGLHDAGIFWATDPEGFYGLYHEDALIAGGAIVSYDNEFGFMGLFIVKPDFRARGLGQMLWYRRRDILQSRLRKGAAIGMDGVLAMQPFYNRGGFEIAFRDERYENIGREFAVDERISPIHADDFAQVLDYDRHCFGFPRPRFLEPWLGQSDAFSFKYCEAGQLQGFGLVRRASKGYKFGPLFADNISVAEALYTAGLNAVRGEALYLDIPVSNAAAVNLVKKYGATYVFECARMYLGKPPAFAQHKVFGITTFELG